MRAVLLLSMLLGPATALAQSSDPHAGHAHAAQTPAASTPRNPKLPPGEEHAQASLESTTRHGEYVSVNMPDGTPIRTWVVYPERKDRAGVVVIIHEIFGLSPWIRGLADHVAKEGYIAVAPDLVSGMGPGGGGTDSTKSRDEVVALVRALTPEVTKARLDAVCDWAVKLPAATSKVATMGFCWGGARSFAYAAQRPDLKAAVVYYGSSPDSAMLPLVKAPVLGLYGADDARVNATIEPAKKELGRSKRVYQPHLFEGAGHGFLRQQSGREGANLRATEKAWPLTVAFFKKYLN